MTEGHHRQKRLQGLVVLPLAILPHKISMLHGDDYQYLKIDNFAEAYARENSPFKSGNVTL